MIGKKLGHSFSKSYFEKKFNDLEIQAQYLNFELDDIQQVKSIINDHPELKGLNVTLPYKKSVMRLVDKLDPLATEVGSVNTLKIESLGDDICIHGYNTDVNGFRETLKPLVGGRKRISALILGTGGASSAVAYVLKIMDIPFIYVSRSPDNNDQISYAGLTPEIISDHQLIINTTPVGMFPKVEDAPSLPYKYLSAKHILYDLIYNPKETLFLKHGREKGAKTMNGFRMLELQAEASWKIWHAPGI